MATTDQKKRWTTGLSADEAEWFYARLDAVPEAERPVYAFSGRKSSLWHKLGGGVSQVLVLFHPDRVVVSTRGMVNLKKEKARREHTVDELTEVQVVEGPLFSSVTLHFRDGTSVKVVDVDHAAAKPLHHYSTKGLGAFDRARLEPKTLTVFLLACMLGLPVPKEHFTKS
ncbi:MAG: hypothetical protein WEE36_04890 [Acidimicrobiia bacterium]